eukprot:CAMPEP_0206445582 /NCGR_PEP_ID=MMETSP0324_2-20121206/15606_1 /ASSEMBLY_ACC=CAM_ASM_000836 /TAXON_ID=2866 /ORGANISM="Crypthecodinium cohnii, Strain Seligo" /LENGTH=680 /DNA_ID=CAMNT_0053913849 /DNA_START=56 /DNA_END=2098 /DNA_ORIENTATION=-
MASARQPMLLLLLAVSILGTSGLVTTKDRPVMKVVRLLQDMQTELQKDLDDDKAVHEKLDCWCKANDKEKTAAIEAGEAQASALKTEMGEAAAKMDELKQKRDATLAEVNRDEAALQEASTLRMKEKQEFHGQDVDLMEAIKACEQAIVVLGKHNAGLAQVQAIAESLKRAQVLELASRRSSAPSAMLALRSFLLQAKSSGSSFLQVPGYQSYAPQSGQIYGVLQQLKEDFEKDLSEAAAKEKKAIEEFAELKAAKEDEISSGRKLQAELDQQIADLKVQHAQAFQELEDTEEQLALDNTFLSNLKAKCSESETEFEQRVKDRLDEIAAVEETIKILNEDEAFFTFDKTVNSFLQTKSSSSTQERLRNAVAVLRRAAAATAAPELALLATRAELDAFEKVKTEIDKMVAELKQQQEDEVKHRDWCIDELAANDRSASAADDAKEALETHIADLEKTIATLAQDIDATVAAVAEMQKQMKRASENREAENAEYQESVTDQRLAQTILKKALARMQKVYSMLQEEPEAGAPHIQTSGNHTDAGNGPARFTEYNKHAGGAKVVPMIQTVIADSRKSEDEAIAAEQEAQAVYEIFMKDSNKAITAYNKKTMNLKGAKAQAEEDITMAKQDLKATVKELEELYHTKGNLHQSCDFIMNTFEDRQGARTAEIDALNEAKAILSGMK